MQPRKPTKKIAKASAAAKNTPLNVNREYVEQIADEAMSTIMALRALIAMLVADREARK